MSGLGATGGDTCVTNGCSSSRRRPTNWVDRYAPAALQPWLKLGRFDRPAGIWMLMLPGWQAMALASAMDGLFPDLLLLAKFFVGAALMRAAGCAFNDIVDRDIDAKVARTAARPLASGEIGVKQALAFIAVCSLISLAILLTMPPLAIGLGVASLVLVAVYPFMKRITWWPQAWLGLTFNWGALLGFAAVDRDARPGPPPCSTPAAYSGPWATTPSTPSRISEDDALVGVKSSARGAGRVVRRRGCWVSTSPVSLLALAAGLGRRAGPALPAAGRALSRMHLSRQAARV